MDRPSVIKIEKKRKAKESRKRRLRNVTENTIKIKREEISMERDMRSEEEQETSMSEQARKRKIITRRRSEEEKENTELKAGSSKLADSPNKRRRMCLSGEPENILDEENGAEGQEGPKRRCNEENVKKTLNIASIYDSKRKCGSEKNC